MTSTCTQNTPCEKCDGGPGCESAWTADPKMVSVPGPLEFVDTLGRTWRRIPGLSLVCLMIGPASYSEMHSLANAERMYGLVPADPKN